ncbi:MAG: dethiobiotin synthase [Pseudomonadota bacterium]
MKGLFVAGTDTGVGKTMVAAALTAALRRRGINATYMKPVGSDGVEVQGRLVSPDALFAARSAGLDTPSELMSPICLPGGVSPLAASEATGREINLGLALAAWDKLSRRHEMVLVEGVGGLLAPLTGKTLAVELNRRLNLPVLVVARPGLGTINHTLLTIEALERRGIGCIGFCYSGSAEADRDPSFNTNARHTGLFTAAPFWGLLPFLPDLEKAAPAPEAMARTGEALGTLLDWLMAQGPEGQDSSRPLAPGRPA